MTYPRFWQEEIGDDCGRVIVRPALRYREPVDLTDMLFEPAADIQRTPRFDRPDHGEYVGAFHRSKVTAS